MRGRKAKPTATRVLEGNAGKRPLNTREPTPPAPVEDFDTPPPALANSPAASAEWTRTAPMLRKARQITEADRTALVALCLEWARYLEATTKVAHDGMVITAPSGYPMQNPYLSIAAKALTNSLKLWTELGMTPSSRTRVKTDGPGPGGDAFSEFDDPVPAAGAATQH